MQTFPIHFKRGALLACAGIVLAGAALASRVQGEGPPPPSAVQPSPQQPPHVQTDESASLRHGVVAAVDERSSRILVHGVWLQLAGDTTRLVRNGRPAALETLKAGEAIRFALAADGAGNRTVRLIYAP